VQFWPVVQEHIERRPALAAPIVLTAVIGIVWLGWRFVTPAPVLGAWRRHVARFAVAALVVGAASGWNWLDRRDGVVAYSGQVLGFSSHWFAVTSTVGDLATRTDVGATARVFPRVGERAITWPDDATRRPNVVIVMLESVSHVTTSLADESLGTTPVLARLAAEGAEFVTTRVPVAQTNKAFWTAFTGSLPDLEPDYAESVLVDRPYESIASILAARGYRSGFFEMSKGSFECAPGLFSNLGFDWAWFRENLNDESAYLGYMNGDDFRMLDPMFTWVDESSDPFLLTMITTVSHDPYVLPDWYEAPAVETPFERYLQTIKFTDDFLGRVIDELAQRDMLEDTIVCVIGDHGDGFRPESKRGRWAPFEEVIRVPWVIRWPEGVAAGQRIETASSQLDVTPTLLSIMGADVSAAGFDGIDVLADPDAERRFFFSTWYRDSPFGFVEGTRKVVHWPPTNTVFEYDLAADPGERTPRTLEGAAKDEVIDAIRVWQASSVLDIPARRFREGVKYDHWRTFSSGRSAWAYYVP
jgi:hypothetical protein